MTFGEELRNQREHLGLTQAQVAQATGIARPNIAAYEAGRREPRLSTAALLLGAVGASLDTVPAVTWSWTSGHRPYAVPSRLWRLPIAQAMTSFTTEPHVWWSGPNRTFNLADASQRARAYEIVLREGGPSDIESVVDGLLLACLWPELVVPAELRRAWTPALEAALGGLESVAA